MGRHNRKTYHVIDADSHEAMTVSYPQIKHAVLNHLPHAEKLIANAPVTLLCRIYARESASSPLLQGFLNWNLPQKRLVHYLNCLLDRAPYLANLPKYQDAIKQTLHHKLKEPTNIGPKEGLFIGRDGGSPLVTKFLQMGEDALATRFAQYGAAIAHYQLEYAQKNNCPQFANYVLTHIPNHEQVIALYCTQTLPYVHRAPNETIIPADHIDLLLDGYAARHSHGQTLAVLDQIFRTQNVVDFLDDFSRRVLTPAHMLTWYPHPTFKDMDSRIFSFTARECISSLVGHYTRNGESVSHFARDMIALSYTSHHHAIHFPTLNYSWPQDIPKPTQAMERRWHPLLEKPFITRNGYEIHNLTTQSELANESRVLSHCVGTHGYDDTCCKKDESRSHIFSIRKPNGEICSTFELHYFPTLQPAERLYIVQHEGKKINMVRDRIHAGPLHDALQEFLKAAAEGKVTLQTAQLGETAESQNANDLPDIIKSCGYYPTWHNVNLAFQEFKKDIRRGASAVDEQGMLIYDTKPDAHGCPRPIHFIDGIVEANGRTLAMRNMNVQEWLHATRLMEKLCAQAQPSFEPRALTATQPPPLTPEQHRYAHNFSRRPNKLDATRHPNAEQFTTALRSHRQRLQSDATEATPYFAR